LPSASDPSAVPDDEPSAREASAAVQKHFASARWLSFFVPSVADLIFLLLLVSLAAGPLAQRMLGDAGIGWHIRTGELILRTASVPRLDPFSSTMNGKPWYAWEWLYDLVVGGLHQKTGLNGVVSFNALLIALPFALLFRRMLARGAGLGVAVGMLLLALSASSVHFLARPHVVSWLFTVVFFAVLAAFQDDGNTRRLIWLPVLMLVWANVHGGFPVGLILVAIYFVANVAEAFGWDADRDVSARKAKTLALVGTITAGVTLANPYGYQLHLHIYRYLSDAFLMNHIDEFLSPNFHGLAQKCFAWILLLTILGAATTPKRLRASELLLIVFAVYSGLYATRNIPVSSMLLALVIAPHLSLSLRAAGGRLEMASRQPIWLEPFKGFSARMAAMESALRGHLWSAVVVMLGLWACLHHGHLGSRQIMDAHFDSGKFPVASVEWLARNGVRDPIFCPDYWGGYLIYERYPEMPVVVDDRHDLYGAEYLKNYLKVTRAEPGWDLALDEMHTNRILTPEKSPLAALLSEAPKWKEVYHDQTAVVFTRTTKG
jgi:hypothetical protein